MDVLSPQQRAAAHAVLCDLPVVPMCLLGCLRGLGCRGVLALLCRTSACCPAQMRTCRCQEGQESSHSTLVRGLTSSCCRSTQQTNNSSSGEPSPSPCCLASARQLLPQLPCLACGCCRWFHPTTKAGAWQLHEQPCSRQPSTRLRGYSPAAPEPREVYPQNDPGTCSACLATMGKHSRCVVPGRRITAAAVSVRVCDQKEMGLSVFVEGKVPRPGFTAPLFSPIPGLDRPTSESITLSI